MIVSARRTGSALASARSSPPMLACSLRAAARAPINSLPTPPAKRLTARRPTMAAAAATAAAATAVKQVGLRSLLLLLLLAFTRAAAPAPPSCLAGLDAQTCSTGSTAKQV